MTTIVAPSTNPTPIYNRSGVTIDTIAPGLTSSLATAIVRNSGHTVVVVSPSTGANGGYVKLPTDAEIGDVVEVYPIEGFQVPQTNVVTESSAITINSYFWDAGTVGFYRLLSSNNWGAIWSQTK